MDVGLRLSRTFFYTFFLLFLLIACGGRLDTDTDAGRNALITDANIRLSHGDCQGGYNDIMQLYNSSYRTEQVVLITASADACFAGFNFFTLAANITNATNFFSTLAMSMPSQLNDGHIASMYAAEDILTSGNKVLSAASRSVSVNNYMVFLQMGVIGAILSSYGKPDASGTKSQAISYHIPQLPTDLSTLDACALAAAFSIFNDSYSHSSLSDSSTASLENYLNQACVAAGYTSCAAINQDRTLCTGVMGNQPSIDASFVAEAVNSAW